MTPKQSRFVTEYLVDQVGSYAAVRAGYSPNSAKQAANRLLRHPGIREAIDAGQAELAERNALSADRILRDLSTTFQAAFDKSQYAAAIRALELIGKHLGMFDGTAPSKAQLEAYITAEIAKLEANEPA